MVSKSSETPPTITPINTHLLEKMESVFVLDVGKPSSLVMLVGYRSI